MKVVAGIVLFGAFGVFMGFLGVRAVVEGRWAYLWFYVPATIIFLLPPLLVPRATAKVDVTTMREFAAEHGGGEFRVQRDLQVTIGTIALATVATIGCAAFSIGVWTNTLTFELSGRQRGSFPVVVAILGLVAAWGAISTAIRGTSASLALRPNGIQFAESGMSRRRIAWDDIADMTLTPQQQKKRDRMYSPTRVWLIRKDPNKRPTSIALNWPMGNRAAFWLIHFYWTHPELRDELADDRVVERIASGRIVEEVA